MRAAWRRWLALFKRVVRKVRDVFPLTAVGVAVAAGAVVAVITYGFHRFDLVLLAAGMVAAALLVASLVSVAFAVWGLSRALRRMSPESRAPIDGQCGTGAWTSFVVRRSWLPFVRIAWTWERPEANVRIQRRGRELLEEVFSARRFEAASIVRAFEVSDSFGFCAVTLRREEPRSARFVPTPGALRDFRVVRSLAGGDALSFPDAPDIGERIDMRRYVAGDPIRFVLWKVYARTGELVVRTPERAISPIDHTVAYLVTGRDDEASAGAARVAIEVGALGSDWVFGSDSSSVYARDRRHALELLASSGGVASGEGGTGLARFLSTATRGPVGRAVVFVPASLGPWLEHVRRAARSFSGQRATAPIEFVVAVDGVLEPRRAEWFQRFAFRRPRRSMDDWRIAEVERRALDQLVPALRGLGAQLTVVDRSTGALLVADAFAPSAASMPRGAAERGAA